MSWILNYSREEYEVIQYLVIKRKVCVCVCERERDFVNKRRNVVTHSVSLLCIRILLLLLKNTRSSFYFLLCISLPSISNLNIYIYIYIIYIYRTFDNRWRNNFEISTKNGDAKYSRCFFLYPTRRSECIPWFSCSSSALEYQNALLL